MTCNSPQCILQQRCEKEGGQTSCCLSVWLTVRCKPLCVLQLSRVSCTSAKRSVQVLSKTLAGTRSVFSQVCLGQDIHTTVLFLMSYSSVPPKHICDAVFVREVLHEWLPQKRETQCLPGGSGQVSSHACQKTHQFPVRLYAGCSEVQGCILVE